MLHLDEPTANPASENGQDRQTLAYQRVDRERDDDSVATRGRRRRSMIIGVSVSAGISCTRCSPTTACNSSPMVGCGSGSRDPGATASMPWSSRRPTSSRAWVPLVPPPGAHQLVYHGLLAARSALRAKVIPDRPKDGRQHPMFDRQGKPTTHARGTVATSTSKLRHISWEHRRNKRAVSRASRSRPVRTGVRLVSRFVPRNLFALGE